VTAVLVTGATGFLGEHLCRVLTEQGHTVRGLARSRSGVLADLGVEHVRGDVLAGPELDRALDGVHAVFHLAGAESRDPDDAHRMMRLHVDGTRRVLERMAAAGVTRMVVASTSGTIGVSKDEEILDETAPYAEEIVAGWPYYASKIYQERLAFEHGKRLDIGHDRCLQARGDPRRDRAVRRGDRRRLAVLRLEDLPGAPRVRARRATRHRGRGRQPVAAARPR
jgi:dihydroflavonol-4-reductase